MNREFSRAGCAADLFVTGNQSLAAIHDNDEQVSRLQSAGAARDDELVKRILTRTKQTPRVGDVKFVAAPRDRGTDDVTSGSGRGRDDRAPSAGQTIEQRRLTYIWSTDQYDLPEIPTRHGLSILLSSKDLRGLA